MLTFYNYNGLNLTLTVYQIHFWLQVGRKYLPMPVIANQHLNVIKGNNMNIEHVRHSNELLFHSTWSIKAHETECYFLCATAT